MSREKSDIDTLPLREQNGAAGWAEGRFDIDGLAAALVGKRLAEAAATDECDTRLFHKGSLPVRGVDYIGVRNNAQGCRGCEFRNV
jgi:hypothetical protein